MLVAKRVVVLVAIAAVLGAGLVIALPWSHDLDNQISIKPQELVIPPPEFSVPVQGREFKQPLDVEKNFINPIPADEASIARGAASYATFCTPCHGADGTGGGEVVKRGFIAASSFLSDASKARTDGFMYSYIRHGGAIMPPYAFGLKPEEAWDVVNYLRSIQRQDSSN